MCVRVWDSTFFHLHRPIPPFLCAPSSTCAPPPRQCALLWTAVCSRAATKGNPSRGVGMLVVWPCRPSLFRIIPSNTQTRTVRIIVRPRANPGKGPRHGLEALPWPLFVVPVTEVALSCKLPSYGIISSDGSLENEVH